MLENRPAYNSLVKWMHVLDTQVAEVQDDGVPDAVRKPRLLGAHPSDSTTFLEEDEEAKEDDAGSIATTLSPLLEKHTYIYIYI